MPNGDRDHPGDGAGKGDGAGPRRPYGFARRRPQVDPVMALVSAQRGIGGNQRTGHRSPQARPHQQFKEHFPLPNSTAQNIWQRARLGKGVVCAGYPRPLHQEGST